MKKLSLIQLLLVISITTTWEQHAYGAMLATLWGTALGKLVTTIGGFTAAYYWFVPDKSMPTLKQLNVITLLPTNQNIQGTPDTDKATVIMLLKKKQGTITINNTNYKIYSGIPQEIKNQTDPVFMYSGGYSNNGNPYAYCAYTAIKCKLIQGPCIVFDYATDTRRAFNFCQEQDIECVRLVYNELRAKAPEARVILHGACKGAMNNLRFLETEASNKEEYLSNIKAVIAESPVISVQKALSHWRNGAFLSHWLCRFALPNYTPKIKTIMQASKFPNIPVFVGSLPHDTLSRYTDVKQMVEYLTTLPGTIIRHHTSPCANIWHGEIGKAEDYRCAVDNFLKEYQLRNQICVNPSPGLIA